MSPPGDTEGVRTVALRRRHAAGIAVLPLLAACSVAGGPASPTAVTRTATPLPTPTPAPPHPLEFAVLLSGASNGGAAPADDVLSILDPTGGRHGVINFAAPLAPDVGNAVAVMQLPAVAADGAAYYADRMGGFWRLAPDSATSPQRVPDWFVQLQGTASAQQELSFVVSPDGSQMEALVLTFAQPQTGCPGPCGLRSNQVQAKYWQELPGNSNTFQATPFTFSGNHELRLFAWDAAGPVELTDAAVGTQDGVPGYNSGPFGHAVQLASDFTPGTSLGPAACQAADVPLSDGTVVCAPPYPSSGTGSYRVSGPSAGAGYAISPGVIACGGCTAQYAGWVRLAPDAMSVAMQVVLYTADGKQVTRAEVLSRSGTVTRLPDSFAPEGWLDASTLVGTTDTSGGSCPAGGLPGNDPLAVVSLATPSTATPLHSCGVFVGVVRPASS